MTTGTYGFKHACLTTDTHYFNVLFDAQYSIDEYMSTGPVFLASSLLVKQQTLITSMFYLMILQKLSFSNQEFMSHFPAAYCLSYCNY